jgi:hypothetical protein
MSDCFTTDVFILVVPGSSTYQSSFRSVIQSNLEKDRRWQIVTSAFVIRHASCFLHLLQCGFLTPPLFLISTRTPDSTPVSLY